MNKGLGSIVGAIALSLTAPAWSAGAAEQPGWFIEGSVLEAASAKGESPFVFDDEKPGIAIGGGYGFTKHLSLAAFYHELGEHTAVKTCTAEPCTLELAQPETDIRGLSVAAIGTWRVARIVEVFGKVGVIGTRADYEGTTPDDSDRGALFGAGVGIHATPHWRINVLYERADHDLELESAGVGVTYRF